MLKNRILKNIKKLHPWAKRHNISAYRIYDRDIPEFPFMIDFYNENYVVHDRTEKIDEGKGLEKIVQDTLTQDLKADPKNIIYKKRVIQTSENRVQKISTTNERITVQETQAKFLVNLHDYLDTGLFLDHRPMRQIIFKQSHGKKFLNLFSYTCSVSVFAALGGAKTTSVDMSANYLQWGKDNFEINSIDIKKHEFVCANVLEYIKSKPTQNYDIIFLDPPSFSNSKKMQGTFDVQRDHVELILDTLKHLKPDGVLYFSTNNKKFRMSADITNSLQVVDITKDTIPVDFHDQKIHYCYRIRKS